MNNTKLILRFRTKNDVQLSSLPPVQQVISQLYIVLPWPKKNGHNDYASNQNTVPIMGYWKNQAWLHFGVQRCAKSRPAAPPCQSPDHADHADIAW